ncbi:MAG: glycosyltransferase family 39 protein [Thermoflexales bacterium]|nr:glycosyltransferase family 39 protein [Thermoflexales bacterium]
MSFRLQGKGFRSRVLRFTFYVLRLRSSIPRSTLLLLAVLVAFAIRLDRLGAADLTFDESASAFISAKSYSGMLAYLLQAFHELPPVYYVGLRAWRLAAGACEYALRFPSACLGVLSVALLYRVGRRRLDRLAALAAATLLVVQPFHIHYSQDARPYVLMIVEGLILFELFQRVRGGGRWTWWLAFGALAVVSVLTHYLMAFVLVAINVYALSTLNTRRPALLFAAWWFGAQVAVGSLFALYLFSSRAARNVLRSLQGFTLHSVLGRIEPGWGLVDELMWGVQARPWPSWSNAVLVLVAAGLCLSLLAVWRRGLNGAPDKPGRWSRWLVPIYLLVPLALVIASPERLYPRYAAAVIPAYCLSLGLVVAWLARWHWLPAIALWGVLMAANAHVSDMNAAVVKSDYGKVVSYLNAHLQPGDAIIFNGPWQWVQQLYYPITPLAETVSAINREQQPVEQLYAPPDSERPVYWLPHAIPIEPAAAHQTLQEIASQYERAWVLPAAVSDVDPQKVVANWLDEHAYYSGSYKELKLYVLDRTQAEIVQPLQASFDTAFHLEQVALTRAQVYPGQPVLASLSLRVITPPGGDLAMGLQLVDRDGDGWTTLALRPGSDFNPPAKWQSGDLLTVRQGVVVPSGTPPGEYVLRISAFLYPSRAGLWPSQGSRPLPTPYIEVGDIHVLPCTECSSELVVAQDVQLSPLDASFGDRLALSGVYFAGREFWQGHYIAFRLLWRPERQIEQDYRLHIALVDRAGRVVTRAETDPVAAWYPTSQWPPGQWMMDRQALLVPPRLSPGLYTLRISVLAPGGQALAVSGRHSEKVLGLFQRSTVLSGTEVDVGQVSVRARERVFRPGPISHPLDVTLGDSVRLLGYDWDGPPQPGQDVCLVLYWQALREMDVPYTVFTHILDPADKAAGQKDSWPRDGDYPTPFWMKGEVISDEYLVPFSAQAQAGEYRLLVGMYRHDTGERLPAVQDGQAVMHNAIVLERFQVR